MSYQPPFQTMPQNAEPMAAPVAPKRGRSKLGVGLILAGVVAAGGVWFSQQQTYKNRITGLERALSGYATELSFEKSGVFTLYYEHQGEVTIVLDGAEEIVELSGDAEPQDFDLVLRDGSGDNVRLSRLDSDLRYSVGGHAGSAYRSVDIAGPGDYELEVISEDPDQVFAIALGIGSAGKPSPALPILIGLAGLLSGLALLLFGRPRAASMPGSSAAALGAAPAFGPDQQPATAGGPPMPQGPPMNLGVPTSPPATFNLPPAPGVAPQPSVDVPTMSPANPLVSPGTPLPPPPPITIAVPAAFPPPTGPWQAPG